MALLSGSAALAGCDGLVPEPGDSVLASVINVTPFEVDVLLSGVLDDQVDTVNRTIGTTESADVPFVCVDEVVVGNPLEPAAAGVVVHVDGDPVEIAPFAILGGESFLCGDIVEIIVSGASAETIAVDVFTLTPP
jgi:hypothetical protein